MARTLITLLAAVLACPACVGGQSGGEVGLGDAGAGGAGADGIGLATSEAAVCDESPSDVGRDELTPLGFSAADVLSLVAGEHRASLDWLPDSPGASVVLTPGGAGAQLTIEIAAAGSQRYVDAVPLPAAGDDVPEPSAVTPAMAAKLGCRSHIEIEVMVTLRTDDGALDERLPGVVTAASGSLATLQLTVDFAELDGSLELQVLDPEGARAEPARLTAYLAAGLFAGELSGSVQLSEPMNEAPPVGTSSAAARVVYARWGQGECPTGSGSVATDATDFLALDAVAELVERANPLEIAWRSGLPSEGLVSLEMAAAKPCRVLDPQLLASREAVAIGDWWVPGETQLRLTSSDGRLEATLPVALSARTDAGQLLSIAVQALSGPPVAAAQFAEHFGWNGVDFGDAQQAILEFGIDYSVAAGGTSAEGALAVYSADDPTCELVEPAQQECGVEPLAPLDGAVLSFQ